MIEQSDSVLGQYLRSIVFYLLLTTFLVNQPSPRGNYVVLQSGRTSFVDSRGGDL